jgi:hypothetical protein
VPTYEGAKTVAAYLTGHLDEFAASPQKHLLKVIECYERISSLLAPAVTGGTTDGYESFMGDLEKQNEHANMVLRPVRDEMAKAAGEIERALAVME